MVSKKSWEEFKESGILWFVNMIIHTFGYAIVYEYDDNNIISSVYPARVKFRGFSEQINQNGYIKISKYIKKNSETLYDESEQ